MTNSTKVSLIYTTINRSLSFMKSHCDNIIDKELFVNIRNQFPKMYKLASQFYNSTNVNDMIKYSSKALEVSSLSHIKEKTDYKDLLVNQYKSISKNIEDLYSNINTDMILQLIDNISDVEQQKINLRLIIKGLMILQILYSIQNIYDTTIENNGTYNHLTEYRCAIIPEDLEHITDNVTINDILLVEENFINRDNYINERVYKLFSEASDDDTIEFTEGDLFEDDYDVSNDETTYSSENIEYYIHKLYLKSMYMLKDSLDKLIDNNYNMLPNINFLMYLTTILLMHYMLKF